MCVFVFLCIFVCLCVVVSVCGMPLSPSFISPLSLFPGPFSLGVLSPNFVGGGGGRRGGEAGGRGMGVRVGRGEGGVWNEHPALPRKGRMSNALYEAGFFSIFIFNFNFNFDFDFFSFFNFTHSFSPPSPLPPHPLCHPKCLSW